jgi:hypothetical protein
MGSQFAIVPELDLVVAVTAGYYQDYSRQALKLQYGIFRDMLRAIPPPGLKCIAAHDTLLVPIAALSRCSNHARA